MGLHMKTYGEHRTPILLFASHTDSFDFFRKIGRLVILKDLQMKAPIGL